MPQDSSTRMPSVQFTGRGHTSYGPAQANPSLERPTPSPPPPVLNLDCQAPSGTQSITNASSTNPPMTSRTSNLVDLNGGWHSDSDSESSLESLRHYFYRKWGLGPSNQKGKNRAEEKSATRQEDQVESRVSISQPNNVRSPARQTEELNALHEGRDPGRALTTTERDMLTAGTGAAPLDRRCGTSVKDIGKPAAQEGLIRADKALLSTEAAPGLAGRNRSKVAPVKSPTVNHIPPRRAAVKKRKAIRSTNILTRWKRLLNPQI